jgi:hypothetical protein
MKKILNVEIKKASKVNNKNIKQGAWQASTIRTHAHITLNTNRLAGGSSRQPLGPAPVAHAVYRRPQQAHHQTRFPDQDGSD